MSTAVAVDHVGVAARDLAPMAAAYERLGFALSPVAQQSGRRRPDLPVEQYGSGNRCAFLKHGYIELIAILDPALYDNTLNAFLARYPGMHILALAMTDEDANLTRMRAAGIDIPGVAYLERPVEAGGPIARFARLPFPDPPEGRVQLIRHLTPELVWQERWMDHANKAVALEEVILCAAEPAETAARLSRLSGLPVEPDPAGGFLLRLAGAARAAGPFAPVMETRVRMLTEQALGEVLPGVTAPALPFMAGMVVRTEDGGAAARRVLEGIPTVQAPAGAMVPPAYAAGAAVVFA
ncbi:VOC family protein [Neoroseomonas soli]|uniref:VOC family protein n=1 Tax=Neoroseomonas soli TaxID=1081025 RepID=A0A9X9WY53_9PROT|nr:VOC family protein [Neoroseomonas soli]MBR0672082.1 VOC family protein [Neoroseomonas soli]